MRSVRSAVLAVLPVLFASCHKEQPLCGDPAFGKFVSYDIVEAATGRDWFAGPGRPPGDSLRLLAHGFGPVQLARRVGAGYRVGPIDVDGRLVSTHLLRISPTDLDTVVVNLRYGAVQNDPCGYGPPLEELQVTYNGRPNGRYRASVPADSLAQMYRSELGGIVVRLRKRF